MSFTQVESDLMKEGFSITNEEHKKLLNDKLALFEKNLKLLKDHSYKSGLAAMGAFLTRAIGFNLIFFPTDWACVAYAVHEIHQSVVINQHYRDDFADARALFDWCFPMGADLSAKGAWTADPSIQSLVEHVGPLLSKERISRLELWMNGSEDNNRSEQTLVNSVKSTTTAAVSKTASLVYHSIFGASQPAPKEVMRPEVFAYLIRQLVKGNTTSSFEYYCYGEGSMIFGDIYKKAAQLYETAQAFPSHLKLS